ncbi:MAG: cation acetate symporter [Flavobacteriaceae bacterium]|nr:cation acetate symporter [Flavobacteriaceae bacterium]|tara:strand:+ start:8503 stop:10200 length:1698 start_codon:yes stop_codon:yes gene_type:complete
MTAQSWTYILVGLTFLIYIIIAIVSRAGSTKEFYVAGGGVNPIANGMATAADWMSAASFLSMAGLIAFMGFSGGQYLMGWTGGYVLLALLLAPYLRKFGKFTVPDFIGERYYSKNARLVALICALFVSFTYVVGQMKGVGVAFARFLNVPFDTGVLIGIGIVFFYAVLGGMKGITYTQVAQFCVLIFAFTVPAIFISIQMTGNPIPQVGFGSKGTDGMYLLEKLNILSKDLGFDKYTSINKENLVNMFFITGALMFGTAGLPHVIVRFFTVPRVKDARVSAGWALLFISILYTTAPAVAVFARTNLINTLSNTSYVDVPDWFTNWEKTGLLKFEDKNNDGKIQYVADSQINELKVDQDIIVLANPEIADLPPWVIGLVVAGGLAAALSTAAGLLLVISTSISHDLLKNYLRPNISEKGELYAARIAIAVAVVAAGLAGMNPPGFVAQVVALAFGLAASSFFPAIILGIFDKRMNREGAITGMIVGIVFTASYIIHFKPQLGGSGIPEGFWFGISPEGIGTLGMLINFIISIIVSRLTLAPPGNVIELTESIRTPRGLKKTKTSLH